MSDYDLKQFLSRSSITSAVTYNIEVQNTIMCKKKENRRDICCKRSTLK